MSSFRGPMFELPSLPEYHLFTSLENLPRVNWAGHSHSKAEPAVQLVTCMFADDA